MIFRINWRKKKHLILKSKRFYSKRKQGQQETQKLSSLTLSPHSKNTGCAKKTSEMDFLSKYRLQNRNVKHVQINP